MTVPADRLESELPQILEHLYLGPRPPYADEALRVASRRPRPRGASFLARWASASEPAGLTFAPQRFSWRMFVAAGLVTLALVAGALIVAGQQRALPPVPSLRALPAPVATEQAQQTPIPVELASPTLVGPARNGLIAYAFEGDIYVGDPATGTTTAIATGPGKLGDPLFSPDGTHIAFYRSRIQSRGTGPEIVVVRSDGSNERVVVPHGSAVPFGTFAWTPDSVSLVIQHDMEARSTDPTPYVDGKLSIVETTGAAEPRLLTPPLPRWPDRQWLTPTVGLGQMFRPPEGDRILAGEINALTVFDAELAPIATLGQETLKEFEPYWVRWPGWSPDGSMIVFWLDRGDFGGSRGQIGSFVMKVDESELRRLGSDIADSEVLRLGSDLVGSGVWSPDSAKIAFQRPSYPKGSETVIVIVDAASGAERVLGATAINQNGSGPRPAGWSWSPDGRTIVFVEGQGARSILVDVETGEATDLPWESDSAPSWQRLPLD